MANDENLIPAKKGEVRNPYGKKGKDGTKGMHIKTLAQKLFNDPKTWDNLPVSEIRKKELRELVGQDKTYAEALILAWMQKALSDSKFANIMVELLDGKGKQEIELGGDKMRKITVEFVDGNDNDTTKNTE